MDICTRKTRLQVAVETMWILPGPSENSKSQRLSTLSLAGKLSLSRPASEERSFQSIERTCEDPERMWRQMNALHTGVSAPPDVEVPDVPCLHTSPCSPFVLLYDVFLLISWLVALALALVHA